MPELLHALKRLGLRNNLSLRHLFFVRLESLALKMFLHVDSLSLREVWRRTVNYKLCVSEDLSVAHRV